jgi:hypothetical protein
LHFSLKLIVKVLAHIIIIKTNLRRASNIKKQYVWVKRKIDYICMSEQWAISQFPPARASKLTPTPSCARSAFALAHFLPDEHTHTSHRRERQRKKHQARALLSLFDCCWKNIFRQI